MRFQIEPKELHQTKKSDRLQYASNKESAAGIRAWPTRRSVYSDCIVWEDLDCKSMMPINIGPMMQKCCRQSAGRTSKYFFGSNYVRRQRLARQHSFGA